MNDLLLNDRQQLIVVFDYGKLADVLVISFKWFID